MEKLIVKKQNQKNVVEFTTVEEARRLVIINDHNPTVYVYSTSGYNRGRKVEHIINLKSEQKIKPKAFGRDTIGISKEAKVCNVAIINTGIESIHECSLISELDTSHYYTIIDHNDYDTVKAVNATLTIHYRVGKEESAHKKFLNHIGSNNLGENFLDKSKEFYDCRLHIYNILLKAMEEAAAITKGVKTASECEETGDKECAEKAVDTFTKIRTVVLGKIRPELKKYAEKYGLEFTSITLNPRSAGEEQLSEVNKTKNEAKRAEVMSGALKTIIELKEKNELTAAKLFKLMIQSNPEFLMQMFQSVCLSDSFDELSEKSVLDRLNDFSAKILGKQLSPQSTSQPMSQQDRSFEIGHRDERYAKVI